MKSLSVVIPIYNEERTATALLDRVVNAPLPAAIEALEVVAVDDGSADGTWARIEAWQPAPRADGRPVARRLLRTSSTAARAPH